MVVASKHLNVALFVANVETELVVMNKGFHEITSDRALGLA